jgi:hypothetical protein
MQSFYFKLWLILDVVDANQMAEYAGFYLHVIQAKRWCECKNPTVVDLEIVEIACGDKIPRSR